MKKATAILSALLVAVMMMAASVCAAEINLIPEDADWVMTEAGGFRRKLELRRKRAYRQGQRRGLAEHRLQPGDAPDRRRGERDAQLQNHEREHGRQHCHPDHAQRHGSDRSPPSVHRRGIDFEAGTGYDSGSGDLMNGSYEGEISLANLKGCRRRQSEGLHAGRRQDHHHRNFAVRHGRRGIHGQRAVDQRRQDR